MQSLWVNVRVGGILVRRHQQRGGRGEGRVGGADACIDIIDIVDISRYCRYPATWWVWRTRCPRGGEQSSAAWPGCPGRTGRSARETMLYYHDIMRHYDTWECFQDMIKQNNSNILEHSQNFQPNFHNCYSPSAWYWHLIAAAPGRHYQHWTMLHCATFVKLFILKFYIHTFSYFYASSHHCESFPAALRLVFLTPDVYWTRGNPLTLNENCR